MAKAEVKDQVNAGATEGFSGVSENSKSRALSLRGLNSVDKVSGFVSALISDMMIGHVPPKIGNPIVNATGKILKGLELKHRYGAGKDLKTF